MQPWERPRSDPNYCMADIRFMLDVFGGAREILQATGDSEEARRLFFATVLDGYYSPMMNGMDGEVGHLLYRLADHLSVEERDQILIYPSENGSVLCAIPGLGTSAWDSLEDWRRRWELDCPDIPELNLQELPAGLLELTSGNAALTT